MNQLTMPERLILASAYVPFHNSDFEDLYDLDKALCNGTIFPELHMPKLGMEEFYEK